MMSHEVLASGYSDGKFTIRFSPTTRTHTLHVHTHARTHAHLVTLKHAYTAYIHKQIDTCLNCIHTYTCIYNRQTDRQKVKETELDRQKDTHTLVLGGITFYLRYMALQI